MGSFMRSALRSERSQTEEKVSSKRVIAFILIFCLVGIIAADIFCGVIIQEFIFNGLIEALIWSLAFIGSERFSEVIPALINRRQRQFYPPRRSYTNSGSQYQENEYRETRPDPDYDKAPENQETEDDMR